jgi:iron complex transport system ATP-binding protein
MIKLEVQNLSFSNGRNQIIKDVSFHILAGEIVGLIGPNGCGKSTIIKAISRIVSPSAGEITVDGKDVSKISRSDLARIMGVVPQIPLLPSTFTAFDIVLMGRNPHLGLLQYEGEKDFYIAWQAMEKTATQHLAKRKVGELSGGEIQCVVIARVLAQEPESVLLDEPTANLDINRQAAILDLIKGLCREKNLAVLIALHDLNLASQYCDSLVLIKNGKVHARGKPDEVITSQNIEEVYGAGSCVYVHPVNGLPVVLLDAGNGRRSKSDNAAEILIKRNDEQQENFSRHS